VCGFSFPPPPCGLSFFPFPFFASLFPDPKPFYSPEDTPVFSCLLVSFLPCPFPGHHPPKRRPSSPPPKTTTNICSWCPAFPRRGLRSYSRGRSAFGRRLFFWFQVVGSLLDKTRRPRHVLNSFSPIFFFVEVNVRPPPFPVFSKRRRPLPVILTCYTPSHFFFAIKIRPLYTPFAPRVVLGSFRPGGLRQRLVICLPCSLQYITSIFGSLGFPPFFFAILD